MTGRTPSFLRFFKPWVYWAAAAMLATGLAALLSR